MLSLPQSDPLLQLLFLIPSLLLVLSQPCHPPLTPAPLCGPAVNPAHAGAFAVAPSAAAAAALAAAVKALHTGLCCFQCSRWHSLLQ
jgi:hypothetical protein